MGPPGQGNQWPHLTNTFQEKPQAGSMKGALAVPAEVLSHADSSGCLALGLQSL